MNTSAIIEAREAMIADGALRVDSKVRNLSEEHFEQIVEWLLLPMAAEKVVDLCKKELHLPPAKVPSVTALYGFWRSFGPFWLRAKRRIASAAAKQAGADAENSPVDWQKANADAIQQLTHEILTTPGFNPKTAKAFITATLKLRDQDLAGRKLAMLEAKLAQGKETIEDATLTPEQQVLKMKAIFGITA